MLPEKNEGFLLMSIEDLTSIVAKSPMLTGRVSSISVIFQAPRKKVLSMSMFFFFYTHPISGIFLYVTRVHATGGFGAR